MATLKRLTNNKHIQLSILFALLISVTSGCGDDPLAPTPGLNPPVGTNAEATVCKEGKTYSEISDKADSYTLLSVFKPGEKFAEMILINMDGVEVNSWPLRGYPAMMLPGGSVVGHRKHINNDTKAPGAGGLVELTWDGKEVWNSHYWQDKDSVKLFSRQHHDIVISPSPVNYFSPQQKPSYDGNMLILTNKQISAPAVSDKLLTEDFIAEYKSDGSKTGFEWFPSQHIDEMGFSATDRAAIKENPNWDNQFKSGDWIHLNAMSTLGRNQWYEDLGDERFHPDNIMISSRQANLFFIISRKTGKIVWRVGPDYSKGKPDHDLGQIVGQHHAHLIPRGLPGAGNVLLFDNGGLAGYGDNKAIRTYSRVLEFNPVTKKKVWEYKGADIKGGIFSMLFGAAQRLPNGNTLVTVGTEGLVLEVNSAGKTIWSHKVLPDADGSANYLYRSYRVPPEWLPAGVAPDNYPTWNKRFTCPE